MQTETASAARSHRTVFILLLVAVAFIIIALTLLLYYWDLLVGIYQTVFVVFGFLPCLVAFFVVLYLWVKQTREDAIRQFIREEEERKKADSST